MEGGRGRSADKGMVIPARPLKDISMMTVDRSYEELNPRSLLRVFVHFRLAYEEPLWGDAVFLHEVVLYKGGPFPSERRELFYGANIIIFAHNHAAQP